MIQRNHFSEIIRFGISGIAGFIVDAGIVAILTQGFRLGPIAAQAIAFTVAVTVTWLINRHWTFAEHASKRWLHEWARYVAANSVGAVVNNGVYAMLTLTWELFYKIPILAVAVGALAGMSFNFMSSKKFIFNTTTLRNNYQQ